MLEKVTPDKAVEAMSKYGGTVLKTSLSKADEKELQEALHGGASRPPSSRWPGPQPAPRGGQTAAGRRTDSRVRIQAGGQEPGRARWRPRRRRVWRWSTDSAMIGRVEGPGCDVW